jgi:RNA polymerase sigma-70 factor (ECF subfamily)
MKADTVKRNLEDNHSEYYSWALHCCGAEKALAQDVLQNAYLKIIEHQESYKGHSGFKTWAFAIIKNTARDAGKRLRKERWRFRFGLHLTDEMEKPRGIEPSDEKLRSQFFAEGLRLLSQRQRELFQLVFYHDLTLREAAKVLNISTGAASRHYDRAKKRLVTWFHQKGITINNYNELI